MQTEGDIPLHHMNPTWMQLLANVPALGKYKAYIASAMLMLAGLSGAFHALGDFFTLLLSLLEMKINVFDFLTQAPTVLQPATMFFLGYLGIGLRHGQDKMAEQVKEGTGAAIVK